MLFIFSGRGKDAETENEIGINTNYYLYNNLCYLLISPRNFWYNNDSYEMSVENDGRIYNSHLNKNCGVL